jgi:hypothetical protein
LGFLKPSGRWGLAGVVGVFAKTVFELLDAHRKDGYSVLEGAERGERRVRTLIVEIFELLAR